MFRTTHRIAKQLAGAIAVVALAVPATSAGLPDYASSGVDHRSADAQDSARDAQRGISRSTYSPSPPKTVQASSSGFDWGDAGIGAGSVLGLLLVTLSVMFTVVHRRRRSADGPGSPAVTA
jgi:hypothetical protein